MREIFFFSSDAISLPCLEALVAGGPEVRVAAVFTNPDRSSGRGQVSRPNPVALRATEIGLPVRRVEKVTVADLAEFPNAWGGFVFAFGQLLSADVLAHLPGGFFNLHASPLPLLRGASPLETALAEGWTETGICLMRMVRRMDAGPVAARCPIPIPQDQDGPGLRKETAAVGARFLTGLLPSLLREELSWKEQDESEATFCRKLRKTDGWIDFRLPATTLECRSRAFRGWPNLSFEWNGERIRVEEVSVGSGEGDPGSVGSASGALTVATGKGVIHFGRLQRPGRNLLAADDFLRGTPIPPGSILPSADSVPLVRVP